MNRVLTFLLKYLSFFIFAILEIIALVLFFNTNVFQKNKFFQLTTSISASCQTTVDHVSDYFSLYSINDELSAENAKLLTNIEALKRTVETLNVDSTVIASLEEEVHYVSARVVSNSVNRFRNYIIIDKGSNDGLTEDMGVVCAQGAVGVIVQTSNEFSIVMPIINTEQRISAKISSNNQLGSLVWNGRSPRYAIMEDIPGHVEPQIGDSIITSGYSAIFPEGVLLGFIDEVKGEDSDPFREVSVELAVDYSAVEHVMVTIYKHKNELEEVEKSVEEKEKV